MPHTRLLFLAAFVGLGVGASMSGCSTKPPCSPSTCNLGCCDMAGNCQNPSQNFCGQQGRACQTCFLGQVCNLGTCMSNQQGGGQGGGMTGGGATGGGGAQGGGAATGGGATGGGATGGGATGGGATGGGATGGGATGGGATGGGATGGGATGGGATGGGATGGGATGGGGGMSCATCTSGCCNTGTGSCLSGTLDVACGTGGQACVVCSGGSACVNGSCGMCNATTCPNGCCDGFGQCQAGTSTGACGRPGSSCEACPLNTQCATARVCVGAPPSGGIPGSGCTTDNSCLTSLGTSTGEAMSCFAPDAGQGFTGGYCLPTCNMGDCIAGTCLNVMNNPTGNCLANCTGTGRGTCRVGYICSGLSFQDGGPAPWGVCFRDCRNAGASCGSFTCNTSTGECQ